MSYPKGFVLELQFRFDSSHGRILPHVNPDRHRYRPTFFGNSGILVYWWDPGSTQLYEIQITDDYAMSDQDTQRFPERAQQARYLRLKDRHKEYKDDLDDNQFTALLNEEKEHLDPRKHKADKAHVDFKDFLSGNGEQYGGGADCLCAVVSGLPVSYFNDVYLVGDDLPQYQDGEIFPDPEFALWSQVGQRCDKKPIGGTEEPLRMTHTHRADFLKKDAAGNYRHFNHTDSDAWNTLWMCFLPAKYEVVDGTMQKTQNASFHTKVNGNEVFNDEVKTGTRTARRIGNENYDLNEDPHQNPPIDEDDDDDGVLERDPEVDVYLKEMGDKKIRIQGHWGSTVKFKKVEIWSVGSEDVDC